VKRQLSLNSIKFGNCLGLEGQTACSFWVWDCQLSSYIC